MDHRNLIVTPIGYIASPYTERYRAPRQPGQEGLRSEAIVTLEPGRNFEQALRDLEGFERIWLLFWFDRNTTWKPAVLPPRTTRKRGLFATRSPHRPNPIGLSLVRLLEVRGRTLRVADVDLLDGTPILDIKPYLPHAEAFPAAAAGWLESSDAEEAESIGEREFAVMCSPGAAEQLEWLQQEHEIDLFDTARRVLRAHPAPHPYKRVRRLEGDLLELAIRSWRLRFRVEGAMVTIQSVASGYSPKALASTDPAAILHDHAAHLGFHLRWPG